MTEGTATFVLSTGRCGTQWLAKSLAACYGDVASVEHEPLKRAYYPRQMLGAAEWRSLPNAGLLESHLARIETSLGQGAYIECGWPCYGAIRMLADWFGPRMRVVHLVRHPVPTAASMVTHLYYHLPDREDRLTELGLLTPEDKGVSFPEYRDRWNALERFEKCLYFWAEVTALGLRLERELDIPWLRVSSEEMFGGDGLDRLIDFIGLPRRDEIFAARDKRYDKYTLGTNVALRPDAVAAHPRVMEIARILGYDPLAVDGRQLQARYAFRPPEGTRSTISWNPRWAEAPRNAPCPCGSGLRFKSCHGSLV